MAKRLYSSSATLLCMLILLGINAYICHRLFSLEFSERMESIESSYMSISRWAIDHWADRSWFPLWFTGSPFQRLYQPGLHLSVAAWSMLFRWTPQHSYHFLTALAYCVGPVFLFWLCYHATGSRAYGLFAGLIYSLISPTCFLVPGIRADVGGLLFARRYQILVHYGEGPHTTAVAMLPIAIYLLDRAVSRGRIFIVAASMAIAAVLLTNWPGTIALSMAVAAYCLTELGAPWIHWRRLVAAGALAYVIACRWIPPSTLMFVFRNAKDSDNTVLGMGQAVGFASLLAGIVALHLIFQKIGVHKWIRFFIYFTSITGAVSIGREWFDWHLLPQPNRVQVELEMALSGALAFLFLFTYRRIPKTYRIFLVAVVVVVCADQIRRYRIYADSLTRPIAIQSTIEYKMDKYFDGNWQGHRVFAPGNVALWMNMFTDVPQFAGCCDQSVPSREHRIALYTVYTGQNTGTRDAEISLLWLKAYGVDAIGVSGPLSTEYHKPYWNPRKFDGVLKELWRDGDNAVYDIPRKSSSLAHVVDRSALVMVPPVIGLDTDRLSHLVSALDDPGLPTAKFRWINQHEAEIDADVSAGQVIFVQITYDRGWHVSDEHGNMPIIPDALGLMAIDPGRSGRLKLKLVYERPPEGAVTDAVQAIALLLLIGISGKTRFASFLRARRSRPDVGAA